MKVRILIQFLVSLRLAGETLPCGGEEAGLQEYQVLRIEAGCVRHMFYSSSCKQNILSTIKMEP